MKLIRIFGIVLALHLVGGLLFFQPGCQSKPQPQAADTMPKTGDPTAQSETTLETVDSGRPRSSPGRPNLSSSSSSGSRGGSTQESDSVLQPLEPIPSSVPSGSRTESASGGTYTVKSGDSLWGIANRHGVSLSSLLSANGLSENSVIQPGQKLTLPAGSSASGSQSSASGSGSSAPQGTTTYKVRRGDSLSAIAQRHNTTVSELKSLNNLSSDVIRIDQSLVVPAGGNSGAAPAPRSSSSSSGSSAPAASGATHTVTAGETPGAIATRYGVSIDALMSANNISDPRRMQIGQKLVIPGKEQESSGAASTTSARSSEPKPEPAETQTPDPAPAPEPEPAQEDDLFIIPIEEEDDFPIIPILPEN